MAPERAWRVTAGDALAVREWDGDYAVFDPVSGSTHLLDVVSGETVRAIIDGAATTAAASARVAAFLAIPNDASVEQRVARIVAALDELGLIEPLPRC